MKKGQEIVPFFYASSFLSGVLKTRNDFEIISDSSKLKQPLLYADLTACVM